VNNQQSPQFHFGNEQTWVSYNCNCNSVVINYNSSM